MDLSNVNFKKIGLIALFIVFVFVCGYFIYSFFFTTQPSTGPTTTTGPTSQLPGTNVGEQPGIVTTPGQTSTTITGQGASKIPSPNAGPDLIARGGITKVNDLDYDYTSYLSGNSNNAITYNPTSGKFYALSANGQKTELTSKIYKSAQNVVISPQKNSAILEFPDGTNIYYDFNKDKQITLPKDWTEFNFAPSGDQI